MLSGSSPFVNRKISKTMSLGIKGSLVTELASANTEPIKPIINLTPDILHGFVFKYLKNRFDNPVDTPWFHREMWRLCLGPDKYVALAAPRGHAKSSSITLAFILAQILFRQRDFVLLLSDSWAQSVEFLRDLKTELSENEEMIRDFHLKKFVKDSEDDVIVQFLDGSKFRIVARGSEQKVRGLKWNHRRPNLVVGDDLEGDEQVESKLRREKFMNWLLKAVLPCGSSDCVFRIVGTVLHFDSALNRLLKNPSWKSKVFKAHKSFNDFSEILWPEAWSEERLKGVRQVYIDEGQPEGYSCEYLNDPIAEGNAYFRADDIFEQEKIPENLQYYAGWDFAVTKDQKSDFTVCSVFGVSSEGRKYVVDIRRGRMDMKEIVDEMIAVQDAWSPAFHFVEAGTIWNSMEPSLNAEMMTTHKYLNCVKLPSSKDKTVRARNLQWMTKAKHLVFHKGLSEWAEAKEEFMRFPKGQHDDIVDSMSIIGRGLEYVNSAQTEEEVEEEEYRSMTVLEGRSETTGY